MNEKELILQKLTLLKPEISKTMRDELLKMEAEYDIPDEVDMSGAVRGYFYTPHKVSVSMRQPELVFEKV